MLEAAVMRLNCLEMMRKRKIPVKKIKINRIGSFVARWGSGWKKKEEGSALC